jgi:MFS family permease
MSLRHLRHRNAVGRLSDRQLCRLVYSLFFAAGIAQSAIVPLLPRLDSEYALSPSATALLLALPGLATLIVSVPVGFVADRFGARRVTLAAGWLICAACLAEAMPSLLALLLGRLAFGIGFGVVWTSGMAWLSELQSEAGSSRLGPSVTSSAVGVMVGPALGGALAGNALLGVPFLVIAVVSAVVVVPLALGSTSPRRRSMPTRRRRRPKLAGRLSAAPARPRTPALLGRPAVLAAVGALVVSGAVSGVSQLLITLQLHRDGLSPAMIGTAFSAAAVCYIATSGLVVRLGERANTLRFNALATLALALALVPALLAAGPFALIAALLLTAPPRAAVGTIAYSLAAARDQSGRSGDGFVFGTLNGCWAGATVLAPLLAGALDQRAGVECALLVVVIPGLAIAAWLVARSSVRRTRRSRFQARSLGSSGISSRLRTRYFRMPTGS